MTLPRIDFATLRFESPILLWLLVVPAVLAGLWTWRVLRRRADVRRLTAARVLPVRERYNFAGDLTFWLAVLVAAALCIVAVAKFGTSSNPGSAYGLFGNDGGSTTNIGVAFYYDDTGASDSVIVEISTPTGASCEVAHRKTVCPSWRRKCVPGATSMAWWRSPALPHTTGPTPGSLDGPTTAAPAPSAKMMQVVRSCQFVQSESFSEPMSRTLRACPPAIAADAFAMP